MVVTLLFFACLILLDAFQNAVNRPSKRARLSALGLAFALALSAGGAAASAATRSPTITTLAMTSGGGAATSVASGSVVTLTASVASGSTNVTTGQVNFCDALASHCTDVNVLGTAQLTSAGTAVLKFRPGMGSHSYTAVFAGTNTYAGSSSSVLALVVTGTIGQLATTTTLAKTGSWGKYELTATVTETGSTVSPTGTVSLQDTGYANAVLGTAALGAGTPGLTWLNPQTPIVQQSGNAVASGDFNGDGIPDLAFVNGHADTVSILLGKGDGTFTTEPDLPTGASPYGIVVADFNGDGNLDLAVANTGNFTLVGPGVNYNSVSIFLGHGDGTFTPTVVSPATGSFPYAIASGDFNGDGIPDLAVGNEGDSTVTILLGNGDGTFTPTPVSPAAGNYPFAIAVGDFNGDGKADLAIGSNQTTISILLGNGDGTFVGETGPIITSWGVSIAVGDFNGDGKQDLAVGNGNNVAGYSSTIAIFLGNGDGTFTAGPADPVVYNGPGAIVIGDFNEDGKPDLAVAGGYSGVTVLLGGGDGTFTASLFTAVPVIPALLSSAQGLAVGDFDGDGRVDLAVAEFNGSVPVLLTEPTQTATATATIEPVQVGNHLVDASYAGDSNYIGSVSATTMLWGLVPGTTTALSITSGGSSVTTIASGTAATLTASVMVGTNPLATGQVNFCDASASDCTDIHLIGGASLISNGTASINYIPGPGSHSYKAILLQNGYGAGSSSSASNLIVNAPAGVTFPTTTAIAQSGTVGNYTLTATITGIGSATADPTGSVSFLDTSYGNAVLGTALLGTAAPGLTWLNAQTASTGTDPIASATGDFNRDGKADLATLNQGSGTLTILLGNGDGTFTPTSQSPSVVTQPGSINLGGEPALMLAVDLNGDGILDLAVATTDNSGNSTVAFFLGNGDGTFTALAKMAPVLAGPESMVAGDFNGDGILDLMVGSYDQAKVTVLLGRGDGSFTQSTAGPVPSGFSHAMAVADLNGDRISDVVVEDGLGNLEVLLGNGDGTFRTTPTISAASVLPNPFLALADFNHDGKLDLALPNLYAASIDVYSGNGDGTFASTPVTSATQYSAAGTVLVGDFNGDGIADLATQANNNGNLISILLGKGDGSFVEVPQTSSPSGNFYIISSLALADFNGDGRPDVAVVFSSNSTVQALLVEPTQTATGTLNGISPTGPGQHQVDASYPGNSNYNSSVSTTTALTAQVATPVISPSSGTYTSVQAVSMTDSTPGAAIYYTIDGSAPSSSSLLYTGPITVQSHHATIQAIAVENGYEQSATATATFTLNLPVPASPVISLASGTYPDGQTVTISDATPNAVIYYTTNGSLPSTSSTQYTGPISISSSGTLVAIAANGFATSAPVSAQYIISSSSTSFIYTLAGNGAAGYAGDGGAATFANLNFPTSGVVDSAGNLYIADSDNNVIRKVAASTGVITTFAGTGISGYSGDNGPATSAQLNYPTGLSVDSTGNLYFADDNNSVVRLITAASGVITTVAGNGTPGYGGDGIAATSSQMSFPSGTAVDSAGNLYIADLGNSRIREVAAKTGIITTVAGGGFGGFGTGDGGPATAAHLNYPQGVAVDALGNLYIADTWDNAVRKVTAGTGAISTVAGSIGSHFGYSTGSYSGDGGPATSAGLNSPEAVTVDSSGNLYIADTYNQAIRKVTASNGIITTIAGNGTASACFPLAGDGGPATSAALCFPHGVSIDGAGNVYIADTSFNRLRVATPGSLPPTATTAAPVITVPAGTYASPQTATITDATPGASIYLTTDGTTPSTVSSGYNGPINVSGNVTIRAVAVAPGHLASAPVSAAYIITSPPKAIINTVAGNGVNGMAGAGGPATSAQIGFISAFTLDKAGNLYLADWTNYVVWKVSAANGNISIVAGNGTIGNNGDGGPATSAQLGYTDGIAVDNSGNIYLAETYNEVIREVTASTGLISTIAGQVGVLSYPDRNGDGGPASAAYFIFPRGLAVDAAGNLYIADSGNNEVRMISAGTGIITSVAGNGGFGFRGEGGPATSASLPQPNALAFDSAGNLYIASYALGRVCKVDETTGTLTTVAGNDVPYGSSGDGGPATHAEIYPDGIALDAAGNLYISNVPGSIRKVDASTGIITKAVGNGYPGYSGDGGSATAAQIDYPQGIALDASGNLYIADSLNYRVRKVTFVGPAPTPIFSLSAGTYTGVQTVTITDSAQGATIYYTTDGTTPTTGSNLYSGAITISATTTLQAIAVVKGYAESAAASAVYTIAAPIGTTMATVTVTPSATTITNQQSISVVVSITGGQATPTGTVTLAGGSYNSQQPLASGAASFSIPAADLGPATNTLTANYSGDAIYAIASGTTTITVAPVVIVVPPPSPAAPGSVATATATLSAGSTYSGTMSLTCALTASPSGARSLPTCSLNPSSVTIAAGGNAATIVTVKTTAASTSSAFNPPEPQNFWEHWTGGGVLALALIFGVPTLRRRRFVMMLTLCAVTVAGLIGCGGGGGSSSNPPTSTPATTAGSYTFTVTGTDASNAKITASTNLTITVK